MTVNTMTNETHRAIDDAFEYEHTAYDRIKELDREQMLKVFDALIVNCICNTHFRKSINEGYRFATGQERQPVAEVPEADEDDAESTFIPADPDSNGLKKGTYAEIQGLDLNDPDVVADVVSEMSGYQVFEVLKYLCIEYMGEPEFQRYLKNGICEAYNVCAPVPEPIAA